MKFCEKIIKLRKQHGLSQEEFGGKINVSRQTISKWEAEQSQPDYESLREISEVFNVSLDYLLNDTVDNEKQICKKTLDKKKIIKITIFVIIGLIALYLVYSAYKFVLLLGHNRVVNAIRDYEQYSIKTIAKLKDESADFMESEFIHYTWWDGNVYFMARRDNLKTYFQERTLSAIYFINPAESQYYYLLYDEAQGKYVFEDLAEGKTEAEIQEMLKENRLEPNKGEVRELMQDILNNGEPSKDENGNYVYKTPLKTILLTALDLRTVVTKDYIMRKDYYAGNYEKIDLNSNKVEISGKNLEGIAYYNFGMTLWDFSEIKSVEDLAEYFQIPM